MNRQYPTKSSFTIPPKPIKIPLTPSLTDKIKINSRPTISQTSGVAPNLREYFNTAPWTLRNHFIFILGLWGPEGLPSWFAIQSGDVTRHQVWGSLGRVKIMLLTYSVDYVGESICFILWKVATVIWFGIEIETEIVMGRDVRATIRSGFLY